MRRMMQGGWLILVLVLIAGLAGCSGGSGSSLVNTPVSPGTGQTGNNGAGGNPAGGTTNNGGGTTAQGGRAVFQVNWDASDTQSHSAQVQVMQGDNVIATQIVNRTGSESASNVTFDNLPAGTLHFIATLFSDLDAHGTTLKEAADQLEVKINQLVTTILHDIMSNGSILVLAITQVAPELHVGQSVQLLAEVRTLDGSVVMHPPHTVTWSTDDPTIATVDSNGVLHGVKAGSTNVTATLKYSENGSSVNMQMTTNVTVLP